MIPILIENKYWKQTIDAFQLTTFLATVSATTTTHFSNYLEKDNIFLTKMGAWTSFSVPRDYCMTNSTPFD